MLYLLGFYSGLPVRHKLQVCLLCRARVEALQAKFNQESRSAKLELVLFQDALLHLLRISR